MSEKDPYREFMDWQERLPRLPPNATPAEVQFYLGDLARASLSATMVSALSLKKSAEVLAQNNQTLDQVRAQMAKNSELLEQVLQGLSVKPPPAPTNWKDLLGLIPETVKAIPPFALILLAGAIFIFVIGKMGLSFTDGEHTIMPALRQDATLPNQDLQIPES